MVILALLKFETCFKGNFFLPFLPVVQNLGYNCFYMKLSLFILMIMMLAGFKTYCQTKKSQRIFDGTFKGWEGDTLNTWRIEDGSITGGSFDAMVPHNNFLVTTRSYKNYILRLKVKLVGSSGFVNGGVQFHSRRLTNPSYEMTGYQADVGPGYWGSLYDESRRNKSLVMPDSAMIATLVKHNDWNNLEVQSHNGRIRILVNGKQTVAYTEPDKNIPQSGLIGLQVHGGGKAKIYYKDIMLEERK